MAIQSTCPQFRCGLSRSPGAAVRYRGAEHTSRDLYARTRRTAANHSRLTTTQRDLGMATAICSVRGGGGSRLTKVVARCVDFPGPRVGHCAISFCENRSATTRFPGTAVAEHSTSRRRGFRCDKPRRRMGGTAPPEYKWVVDKAEHTLYEVSGDYVPAQTVQYSSSNHEIH